MRGNAVAAVVVLLLAAVAAEPALAHHVMGGKMPETFMQGFLSGLGHPVIGLDHFAAVVAIGCLAAAHRAGPALVVAFVVAMMAGVAVHLQGMNVIASEIMVALSVIVLGWILLRRPLAPFGMLLGLFVAVGLLHGYALGESIFGAERSPLAAYLIGLAVIQSAVALAALWAVRAMSGRVEPAAIRFVGAGIAGIGLAILVQQLVPAV